MATWERVFLNPSSHSRAMSRFILPRKGLLSSSTLHVQLAFENDTGAPSLLDSSWWLPRAGAFALIDSVSVLRDGQEISFTQNVGPLASMKAMMISDTDHQARHEEKTGGALLLDIPESGQPAAVGDNGLGSHTIQYAASVSDLPVTKKTLPMLPLRFVSGVFDGNALVDTLNHGYEIIITWLSSGVTNPAVGYGAVAPAPIYVSSDVRLVYTVGVGVGEPSKPLALNTWREIRTTMFTVPALTAGLGDQQTIPIRFASTPADAVFFAFVDAATAVTSFCSAPVAWGNCWSGPISFGSYELNLQVNGATILPRPITQDAERIHHFAGALEAIGGSGTIGQAAGDWNVFTENAAAAGLAQGDLGRWTRGHSILGALGPVNGNVLTMYSSSNYWGFDLRENLSPVMLNQQGLYLTITRSSFANTLPNVPALIGYAFLIGPRSA